MPAHGAESHSAHNIGGDSDSPMSDSIRTTSCFHQSYGKQICEMIMPDKFKYKQRTEAGKVHWHITCKECDAEIDKGGHNAKPTYDNIVRYVHDHCVKHHSSWIAPDHGDAKGKCHGLFCAASLEAANDVTARGVREGTREWPVLTDEQIQQAIKRQMELPFENRGSLIAHSQHSVLVARIPRNGGGKFSDHATPTVEFFDGTLKSVACTGEGIVASNGMSICSECSKAAIAKLLRKLMESNDPAASDASQPSIYTIL